MDLQRTALDAAREDPSVGLRAVAALRRLADRFELVQVTAARRAEWTWQQIGDALGITGQAVHKKYGR